MIQIKNNQQLEMAKENLCIIVAIYIIEELLPQRNKQCGIQCNRVNVYEAPLPLYTTQIINPFLNSIISDNHEKQE